jgi:hypothetical protein
MTSDYASLLNGEIIRFDGGTGETTASAGDINIFNAMGKGVGE